MQGVQGALECAGMLGAVVALEGRVSWGKEGGASVAVRRLQLLLGEHTGAAPTCSRA